MSYTKKAQTNQQEKPKVVPTQPCIQAPGVVADTIENQSHPGSSQHSVFSVRAQPSRGCSVPWFAVDVGAQGPPVLQSRPRVPGPGSQGRCDVANAWAAHGTWSGNVCLRSEAEPCNTAHPTLLHRMHAMPPQRTCRRTDGRSSGDLWSCALMVLSYAQVVSDYYRT